MYLLCYIICLEIYSCYYKCFNHLSRLSNIIHFATFVLTRIRKLVINMFNILSILVGKNNKYEEVNEK